MCHIHNLKNICCLPENVCPNYENLTNSCDYFQQEESLLKLMIFKRQNLMT
jgi:hypothetical protein